MALTCAVAALPAYAGARSHPPIFHSKWHQLPAFGTVITSSGPWVYLGRGGPNDPTPGTAINQQTGERVLVVPPGGCYGAFAITGGAVSFDCGGSGVATVGLDSQAVRPIALSPPLQSYWTDCQQQEQGDLEYSCGLSPVAMGADWIEFDEGCGGHCLYGGGPTDTYVFQNIRSGQVEPNPLTATSYADLNSPALKHAVCAPLRVPRAPAAGSIAFYGSFAIVGGGRFGRTYYLERCGSRLRERLDSTAARAPVGNRRLILWEIANEPR